MEPSSEQMEPSSEVAEPSSEQMEPSSEQMEPSSEQMEPSSEQAEPSSEQMEPSSEQAEPSSEQAEPSSEQVEPSSEQAEPSSTINGLTREIGPYSQKRLRYKDVVVILRKKIPGFYSTLINGDRRKTIFHEQRCNMVGLMQHQIQDHNSRIPDYLLLYTSLIGYDSLVTAYMETLGKKTPSEQVPGGSILYDFITTWFIPTE
jgi:hypothetical protein